MFLHTSVAFDDATNGQIIVEPINGDEDLFITVSQMPPPDKVIFLKSDYNTRCIRQTESTVGCTSVVYSQGTDPKNYFAVRISANQ